VRNYGWQDTLRIYTDVANQPRRSGRSHPGDGHLGVVRSFLQHVRGGDWSAHAGRRARRAQIIDACYESAREGREVPVAGS